MVVEGAGTSPCVAAPAGSNHTAVAVPGGSSSGGGGLEGIDMGNIMAKNEVKLTEYDVNNPCKTLFYADDEDKESDGEEFSALREGTAERGADVKENIMVQVKIDHQQAQAMIVGKILTQQT